MTDVPPVPEPGFLVIGRTPDNTHVVLNHPMMRADEHGVGHIVFSPEEARGLAALLVRNADLCVQRALQ